MPIPKGYEVVEEIPTGYEAVDEPESLGVMGAVKGVADIAGAAITGAAKQSVEGLLNIGGTLMGKGTQKAVQDSRYIMGKLPDYTVGDEGQQLIKTLSEKYQAAPEMIKDIVSSFANIGQTTGDAVYGATGSPMLAAGARVLPEAMESVMGFKALRSIPTEKIAKSASGMVGNKTTEAAKTALTTQSNKKQEIAALLQDEAGEISTAPWKLKPTKLKKPKLSDVPLLEGPTTVKPKASTKIPLIEPDKVARATIKQGFDKGVVASIKAASPETKKKMLKMVGITHTGKKYALDKVDNRASNVAGDSLAARVKVVHIANRKAGGQLDDVAKSLKGQKVDHSSAIKSFTNDLDKMGIIVSDDLKLGFKGSDIEGLSGPQRIISQVFNRLKSTKVPDAYDVHRMKRFIDEQVTYGKTVEGLSGKTKGILKSLRHNLDGLLDETFPKYNKINTEYSETINALNLLQDAVGKKMNLTGPNADKALGTVMRRMMGNAQSRVNLKEAIEAIENISKKHGGNFTDDMKMLSKFADELDRKFGAAADTSLQGDIGKVVDKAASAVINPVTAGISGLGKVAQKARGINEENAFKSIRALLKQ